MRKHNPYKNVFFFYRGPSSRKEGEADRQVEDNTTKALINTLENCGRTALERFLGKAGISVEASGEVCYDLQVAEESSRPDASIQIGDLTIFIESKIGSPLDENQIKKHLNAINNGLLVCITPRDEDKGIIDGINKEKLKFLTWKESYLAFRSQLRPGKDEKERFLIEQFLEYLEEISMAPFNGWDKKDFEAFLNIEDDQERMLRLRVKEKLNQYLKELKKLLDQENLFVELIQNVGNIKKDSDHAWGVLCKPPVERKVHVPHFNWWINPDEFGMGIQIEGKTPSYKTKAKISADKGAFLDVLKEVKGFDLVIREREKRSDRPRDFQAFDRVRITIDDTTSIKDVEYVLDKMAKYNFFEIHLGKTFKKDEETINKPNFLNKSVDIMKKLKRYYTYTTT